jgi:transcriptional regulator with XRE-family HTH domain
MPQTLGRAIRTRRAELGWTQEDLAKRIGCGMRQSEISRLEIDRVTLPRRERLESISRALGLSLGELLERAGWTGASTALAAPGAPANPGPPVLRFQSTTDLENGVRR